VIDRLVLKSYILGFLPGAPAGRRGCLVVGAENLGHQAIFANHAPGAIAWLNPKLIQNRDAAGQLP
jgi:hypothetical protein